MSNIKPNSDDDIESLAHDLLGVDLHKTTSSEDADLDEPLDVDGLGLDDLGFDFDDEEEETASPAPLKLVAEETATDSQPDSQDDDPLAWIVKAAKAPPRPVEPVKTFDDTQIVDEDDWDDDDGFGSGLVDKADSTDDDLDVEEFDDTEDEEIVVVRKKTVAVSKVVKLELDDDFGSDLDDELEVDDAEDVVAVEQVVVRKPKKSRRRSSDRKKKAKEAAASQVKPLDVDADGAAHEENTVLGDDYWEGLKGWSDPDAKRSSGERSSGERSSESRRTNVSDSKKGPEAKRVSAPKNVTKKKPTRPPEKVASIVKAVSNVEDDFGADLEDAAPVQVTRPEESPQPKKRKRPPRRRKKVIAQEVILDDDDGFGSGLLSSAKQPTSSRSRASRPAEIDDADNDDIEDDLVAEDVEDVVEIDLDGDGFGSGLIEDQPTSPRRKRRAPSRERARSSKSAKSPQPAATETKSVSATQTEKPKYPNVPTWEEAIALLVLKSPKVSSKTRGGSNTGGGRGRSGPPRRGSKKSS